MFVFFISAIVHRIVIKKAARDQDDVASHSISALSFFRKYPKFLDFLSDHLTSILDRESRDLPKHRSAVTYAILSLISKLIPPPSLLPPSQELHDGEKTLENGSLSAGDEYLSNRLRSVIPIICRISYSSRDYHLRSTIGKSLTRLIPIDGSVSYLCSLITRIVQICGEDSVVTSDACDPLIPAHRCGEDSCCLSSSAVDVVAVSAERESVSVCCQHNALHSLLTLLRSLLSFHFPPSTSASRFSTESAEEREKSFAPLFVTRIPISPSVTLFGAIAQLIQSFPLLLQISNLAPPIGVTLADIFLIFIKNRWVSQIPAAARDYLRFEFGCFLFGGDCWASKVTNGASEQTSRPMSSLGRSKMCEILFHPEIFCPLVSDAQNGHPHKEWDFTHQRLISFALSDRYSLLTNRAYLHPDYIYFRDEEVRAVAARSAHKDVTTRQSYKEESAAFWTQVFHRFLAYHFLPICLFSFLSCTITNWSILCFPASRLFSSVGGE